MHEFSKAVRGKVLLFLGNRGTVDALVKHLELGKCWQDILEFIQKDPDPYGLLYLYLCHQYGLNGVKQNSKMAASYQENLEKFARIRNVQTVEQADALYILSQLYNFPNLGWKFPECSAFTYREAQNHVPYDAMDWGFVKRLLRLAACRNNLLIGNPYAQYVMSKSYQRGNIPSRGGPDLEGARALLIAAVRQETPELGCPYAQWIFSQKLFDGNDDLNILKNKDVSDRFLMMAACEGNLEIGSSKAQWVLAQKFADGNTKSGVVDDARYRKFLIAAARSCDPGNGHRDAQWILYKAYRDGNERLGITANSEKALFFLEVAAKNGNHTAGRIWQQRKCGDHGAGGVAIWKGWCNLSR